MKENVVTLHPPAPPTSETHVDYNSYYTLKGVEREIRRLAKVQLTKLTTQLRFSDLKLGA